ncbi:hypothetical protein D3C81_1103050 [compost metagenome]
MPGKVELHDVAVSAGKRQGLPYQRRLAIPGWRTEQTQALSGIEQLRRHVRAWQQLRPRIGGLSGEADRRAGLQCDG